MNTFNSATADTSRRAVRLLNRDFLLLWQGQFVSQIGNQAFAVAMMYWLMQATGSATLMGLMMMASMLPGVVLGPIGGTFADRHSRKWIIVVSDLLRGVSVLAVAMILFTKPDATNLIIASLFAVALFNGLVSAGFQPAISATIPDLVPRDRVAAANSLNQFGVQAAMLFGQAMGGVLYRVFGAPVLFVIDGISSILSAFSESFIRVPERTAPSSTKNASTFATYRTDTIEGIRYVWRRVGMRSLLLVAAGINFLAMPIIVLLPFFVSRELVEGPQWYGFLLAAMGAGSLIGYLIIGATKIPAGRRPALVNTSLLVLGIAISILGATSTPGIAMASFFIMGICTGSINIIVITLFQIATPAEMRGRVMSLVYTLSGAVSPLGMALGGVLGDVTNKNISAIYIGSGLLIGLVALFAMSRSSFRDFLAFEPAQVNTGM